MFQGGGSIQFSFTYIPDRINHLRVIIINFDICYIRYYALYVSVISYFKETVSKIKLYTDIFMPMQRVTRYLFLAFKTIQFIFSIPFIVQLMKLHITRAVSHMLCGSSSRCHGFVCSLLLWYFLIILTIFSTPDHLLN